MLIKLEAGIFDINVAEYVFFPLSHLFRQAVSLPSKVLELALRCLEVLLPNTWCLDVDSEIYHQLLMLLTFLIDGNQSSSRAYGPSEEVILAALSCLKQFFKPQASQFYHRSVAVSKASLTVLGHVVTVILNIVTHSSNELSSVASETLNTVILSIQSKEVLRNFTPGILSTITRLLQPSAWAKLSSRSIVSALHALNCLLPKVLVRGSKSKPSSGNSNRGQQLRGVEDDWLRSNLPQAQNALSSILRIKKLDKEAVNESLYKFCSTMLSTCNDTMESLTTTLLETLIEVSSLGSQKDNQERTSYLANQMIVQVQLSPLLKDILHRWLMAMPRLVVSHDQSASRRHINNIAVCYEIARQAAIDLGILNMDMITQVLDSVTALLDTNNPESTPILLTESREAIYGNHMHVRPQTTCTMFHLPLSGIGSGETLEMLGHLLQDFTAQDASSFLESQLLKSLSTIDGKSRLANLWLSSSILDFRSPMLSNKFHEEEDKARLIFNDALYSTAIETLTRSSFEPCPDWRMQAISLQIVAKFAIKEGPSFRSGLVESLYPVIESLASSNPQLREYAWLCVRVITQACEYTSANELLTENIDYLINSIALKLNISAVSLEAPRVLGMVVRMCGDTIIPFLNDIIESVYSTLEIYHGYPQLVEALFDFLATVISINLKPKTSHLIRKSGQIKGKSNIACISIMELIGVLQPGSRVDHEIEQQPHPLSQSDDGNPNQGTCVPTREAQNNIAIGIDTSLSRPMNFTTVQSIVSFGQHYLTHDSLSLRCQILNLTGQSCGILYTDENRFLPLVNELWPMVAKRLYDPEASVCIAACAAISEFGIYAGDFIRSRVMEEWLDILRLFRQSIKSLKQEKDGTGDRSKPAYQKWDALVTMLCSLIDSVNFGYALEDDLIEMLEPFYCRREDVRCTLDNMNQDAVWLRQNRGDVRSNICEQPQLEGYMFIDNLL